MKKSMMAAAFFATISTQAAQALDANEVNLVVEICSSGKSLHIKEEARRVMMSAMFNKAFSQEDMGAALRRVQSDTARIEIMRMYNECVPQVLAHIHRSKQISPATITTVRGASGQAGLTGPQASFGGLPSALGSNVETSTTPQHTGGQICPYTGRVLN